MQPSEVDHHLSRIETNWTAVFQAHGGQATAASQALAAMVDRYKGAVHRYLLASLRDVNAADDLAQEFALRLLKGDFKNADPQKGRFRDFLKRSIYNLMVDYHRARRGKPVALADGVPEPAAEEGTPWERQIDEQFLSSWRDHLMAHAWASLQRVQDRTGQPFASVLRIRVDNPDLRSSELAERLSATLPKPVNAGWVRLNLYRARDLFVEALLSEVERSLGDSSSERLEDELIELGLYEHCREALKRRRAAD
jgi:RNA polymerase sigma factor (sigma-70 family)